MPELPGRSKVPELNYLTNSPDPRAPAAQPRLVSQVNSGTSQVLARVCADRTAHVPLEARGMAVFEFIEGWYNPRRRHSALDYLSPVDYERTVQTETQIASP